MPPAIVAIGAAVAGSATTAAVTGTVIAGMTIGATAAAVIGGVVAVGVAYAGSALLGLTDTPDAAIGSVASAAQGAMVNKSANNASIPVVYGSRRIGGTRVFMEVTGASNQYLHIVLPMCEGPISAINTVYLDNVATSDSRFSGLVNVYKHLGATDQTADSALVAACSSWTSDHRLRGVAYLYIRLKYDSDNLRSLPVITADVDGRTLYDPRDTSTAFSRNPALAIRDYLTNTTYGRGIPSAMMDDDWFETEANYCDENVILEGVSKDRFACDGIVDTSATSLRIIEQLLTSCRGMLVFPGGKYRLVIDRPRTPSDFEFDESNIVGSWQISLGGKKETFNRVRASFFNPDRSWQPDIALADSSTYRTADNGLLLDSQIDLPFTADYGRASMIAAISLNQSRQMISCKFTATINGLRAEVGDVVPITHTTPGWESKNFLILAITLKNNDEVDVVAREYDVTVYDYGTIDAADATPNTNLPDPYNLPAPTGLAVTPSLVQARTNKGYEIKTLVSWTAAAEAMIEKYQVEYRVSGDPDWIVRAPVRNTADTIFNMVAGSYDFRVKAISGMGVSTTYDIITSQSIDPAADTPDDIENLTLNIINNQAHLSFDPVADLDVVHGGYIRFRHASELSGASWQSSVDIGKRVPGFATSVVLPLLSGSYLAKAVDAGGNESDDATVVATSIPDIVLMNAVLTADQHPAFSGTKTYMQVTSNKLEFTFLGTDLASGWDFTDYGWMEDTNCTIDDSDSFTTTRTNRGVKKSFGLTIGTTYQMSYSGTGPGNVEIWAGSESTRYSSDFDTDVEFVADHDEIYIKSVASGTVDLSTLTIHEAFLEDITGTYEFASTMDLGAVFTSRVTAAITFVAEAVSDYIDVRAGTVDDWLDWDDVADITDVTADIYIRTTDDDPSGTPTWSSWAKFAVGDYSARAFQFKIECTSGDRNHQISISALSATVDMPDRVLGEQGVAVGTGGKTVTYASAFYATPSLGVTISDMATGDYMVITGESATGFTIIVRDSAGSAVARTMNYLARGY